MLIRKLHLENFKCFKNFDAEFSEGVNLIIGVNGSGKTALLEGLSIAAGSFWQKLSEVEKRNIEKKEVRVEPLSDFPEYQFPVIVKTEGDVLNQINITWSRELNSISGGTTSANAKDIAKQSQIAQDAVGKDINIVLPIIAYFSTGRLHNDRNKPRTGKDPIGKLRGYYNALNDTNIKRYIQLWFGDRENWVSQNEKIGREIDDSGLELLRSIIKITIPQFKSVFYYNPQIEAEISEKPKGLYLVSLDGTILHESQFSDGYRNLLWLFIEMAWRCYMLNPFLGERANEETNGIVMIDEVDLHLHPGLQQKIVKMLSDAFPKIQFILTTHSPVVVGSVKKNLYILKDKKLVRVEETPFGKETSYIVQNMMETESRQPEVTSRLTEYFTLINEGEGSEVRALELRKVLDNLLGAADPALVKADVLLSLF